MKWDELTASISPWSCCASCILSRRFYHPVNITVGMVMFASDQHFGLVDIVCKGLNGNTAVGGEGVICGAFKV
jgi:hypothetical protein